MAGADRNRRQHRSLLDAEIACLEPIDDDLFYRSRSRYVGVTLLALVVFVGLSFLSFGLILLFEMELRLNEIDEL